MRRFVGVVDHVDHDHADVVVAPGVIRHAHEDIGCLLRVVERGEDLKDVGVLDVVDETIGTDEEAVAVVGGHLPCVDIDVGVDAEGAGDDVALRVRAGLLGGDLAGGDEIADIGVVAAHLHQLPVLHHVGTRVTDVDDDQLLVRWRADQGETGEGGAHSTKLGLRRGAAEDAVVGPPD